MASGFRSVLGRQVGGLSAPPAVGGFRSFCGFWVGGLCAGTAIEPPVPPTVELGGIPFPWMRPVEVDVRELREKLKLELKDLDDEELPLIVAAIILVLWHDLN